MRKFLAAAAVMVGLGAGSAHAAITIHDPVGDFVPNYSAHHPGTPAASLDITEFTVDLINGVFLLDATFNGSIMDGLPGDWVLGINTGAGANHPFDGIGAGNIFFDKT